MSVMEPLSYDMLDNPDWSVGNLLLAKHSSGNIGRISLNELAVINQHRVKSIDPDRDYLYIEIKDVSPENGIITGGDYVKGANLPRRAKLIAHKGDVIISTVRPERKIVAVITEKFAGAIVSNGFIVLTPTSISTELLYFLFRSDRVSRELSLISTGKTIPTLSLKRLKSYKFPIKHNFSQYESEAKDLYEQWVYYNRPIDIDNIESIFKRELMDCPIKDVEQANVILQRYSEIEDRLDPGYYFSKRLTNIKWKVGLLRLGDLATLKSGRLITREDFSNSGPPYIRLQDLSEQSIYVDSSEVVKVSGESARNTKNRLTAGDLVLTRVGGSLGKVCIIPEELNGAIVNSQLVGISITEHVISEYLALYLRTKWAKQQIENLSVGTAQVFVHIKGLENVVVPLPSIEHQKRILKLIGKTPNRESRQLKGKIGTFVDKFLLEENRITKRQETPIQSSFHYDYKVVEKVSCLVDEQTSRRYRLDIVFRGAYESKIVIIVSNPGVANEYRSDITVNKVIRYIDNNRGNYGVLSDIGEVSIINLYVVKKDDYNIYGDQDTQGVEFFTGNDKSSKYNNDEIIRSALESTEHVIIAYGKSESKGFLKRAKTIFGFLKGKRVYCVGSNAELEFPKQPRFWNLNSPIVQLNTFLRPKSFGKENNVCPQ